MESLVDDLDLIINLHLVDDLVVNLHLVAVATSDPSAIVPSAAVGGMDTQAIGQPTTASIPVSSAEVCHSLSPRLSCFVAFFSST